MSSYKCWSPDLAIPEEEGAIIAETWFSSEDAVYKYIEDRFTQWENPEGPFDILVYECIPDGSRAGPTRTFNVSVEYEPVFYTYEKLDEE